jgi:hypothetical protein
MIYFHSICYSSPFWLVFAINFIKFMFIFFADEINFRHSQLFDFDTIDRLPFSDTFRINYFSLDFFLICSLNLLFRIYSAYRLRSLTWKRQVTWEMKIRKSDVLWCWRRDWNYIFAYFNLKMKRKRK